MGFAAGHAAEHAQVETPRSGALRVVYTAACSIRSGRNLYGRILAIKDQPRHGRLPRVPRARS